LELNDEQTDNVDAMLAFMKATPIEEASVMLDFDHLVTNENIRNILGYDILVFDLPFLKVRKSKPQKPKENPEPATWKGKEKVLEGLKKPKERKEAPKTVEKLLAEREPLKKKQRIEAARSYLKSIGSVVRGIPIRAEPLSTIISEDSFQNAEKRATPQHLVSIGVPVLRDKDVPGTRAAGQGGIVLPVVGDEAVHTAPLATYLDLPELPKTRVDAEVETQEITLLEVTAEVGDDVAPLRVEEDSAAAGPSNRPSVCPAAQEAEPNCSRPFVELRIERTGSTVESTHDSIDFFRPARQYEYDEASLEKLLAGPIMDAVRALTLADNLGRSTAGCIPTEDMIASLV
jgi:hypothetical protein